MEPEGARWRRLLGRRRRKKGSRKASSHEEAAEPTEEDRMSEAELREFLEADTSPVSVDPRFRESLRNRLWRMVRAEAEERRRAREKAESKPRTPSRDGVAPPRRGD